MAYIIANKGKKPRKDKGKSNVIVYDGEEHNTDSLSIVLGIARATMYNRVKNYLAGKINYEQMISKTRYYIKPKKRRTREKKYKIAGDVWTVKKLSRQTGLSASSVRARLKKYGEGRLTAEKVTREAENNKRHNTGSITHEALKSQTARKKLEEIPACGTWEKANLNPTTFISSGGGGVKEHI